MVNKDLYTKDNIPIRDNKDGGKAVWQNIEDFKSGKLILYPTDPEKYLKAFRLQNASVFIVNLV